MMAAVTVAGLLGGRAAMVCTGQCRAEAQDQCVCICLCVYVCVHVYVCMQVSHARVHVF